MSAAVAARGPQANVDEGPALRHLAWIHAKRLPSGDHAMLEYERPVALLNSELSAEVIAPLS